MSIVGYNMNTLDPMVLRYVGGRVHRGEIEPITARNLRNHLHSFSDSFGRRPLEQLGRRAVERWIEEMHRAGLAPSTQHLRVSSLRNFARWCVLERIVDRDWTLDIPRIRRPRQVPRDLDGHHVAAVLGACADTRERLIVWLMWGCGARCVEVARLHVDDYEPAAAVLHLTGKGSHERRVPVPGPVAGAITNYLSEAGHGTGPLIRSELNPTRGLSSARVSGIVGRLIRDAGVKVRRYDGRSAHGIRSASATDLYRACRDAQVVQQYLGHANLATTDVYLRRAEIGRLRDAQEARRWGPPGERDAA